MSNIFFYLNKYRHCVSSFVYANILTNCLLMVWYEICSPVFQFIPVVPLLWKSFFPLVTIGWFLFYFILFYYEEMPVLSPWPELMTREKATFCKLKFFKSERSPNSEQTSETQHLIMFQRIPDYFWRPAFFFVWESPYVNIHEVELLQVLSVPDGTCSIKPAPGSSHHMIWSLTGTCCFDASFVSTRPLWTLPTQPEPLCPDPLRPH